LAPTTPEASSGTSEIPKSAPPDDAVGESDLKENEAAVR
jgi:hypothetical protein